MGHGALMHLKGAMVLGALIHLKGVMGHGTLPGPPATVSSRAPRQTDVARRAPNDMTPFCLQRTPNVIACLGADLEIVSQKG
jgi:hypothetical protein